MASVILGAVGTALGSGFGGTILGLSGATLSGMIGSTLGGAVDSAIVSALTPAQHVEGTRLQSLRVTTSVEGAVIPRVYGAMRLGGNVIWATDFTETASVTSSGGKGGGPKVTTTNYIYSASFAVAICEGEISGIGRIWADAAAMDLSLVTWRLYRGTETQTADPFIAAMIGADNTPAYRGTAYVVFEEIDLAGFGNRLPQLTFEVFRPLVEADTAEGLIRAVTLIPATGEFAYATEGVRQGPSGATAPENLHAYATVPDAVVSLDRLEAVLPGVESVSLVAAWFGIFSLPLFAWTPDANPTNLTSRQSI